MTLNWVDCQVTNLWGDLDIPIKDMILQALLVNGASTFWLASTKNLRALEILELVLYNPLHREIH